MDTSVIEYTSIKEVTNLNPQDYTPAGNTAMFDAIGLSLTELIRRLDAKEKTMAVVTIISDGEENSSVKYDVDKVVSLIEQIKDMGCTVNFMGPSYKMADQLSYAEHMAKQLHIDNFLAFEYTEEGFNEAWRRQGTGAQEYYARSVEYEIATGQMSKKERAAYYRNKNQEDKFYGA